MEAQDVREHVEGQGFYNAGAQKMRTEAERSARLGKARAALNAALAKSETTIKLAGFRGPAKMASENDRQLIIALCELARMLAARLALAGRKGDVQAAESAFFAEIMGPARDHPFKELIEAKMIDLRRLSEGNVELAERLKNPPTYGQARYDNHRRPPKR
jgi:hypothetical protein